MTNLIQGLMGLSALAFALAVVTNFIDFLPVSAEGLSRASSNLALLAIALVLASDRTMKVHPPQ